MATQVIKKFTSWSFSRYSDWRECPLKAKLKHLDKIQEPKSPAMERGTAIHDMAEKYLKGLLAKLPAELKLFADEFKKLKALYKKRTLPMIVEDNWAFTAEWTETQWNDWVNCWVRIKLDCAHYESESVLHVTDWKTGKYKDTKHVEYLEQLELYALAALLLHEHIEEVRPRLVYLDEGVVHPKPEDPLVYTRADVKKLMASWNKRVKPMMSDTKFVPKPNANCTWCFFGQAGKAKKGGPGICKF